MFVFNVRLPMQEPNSPPSYASPSPVVKTRMNRFRLGLLFAAPIVLMAAGWGAAYKLYPKLQPTPEPVAVAATSHDGEALFIQHCARCHGTMGTGEGTTRIEPRARYFGMEKYKLASTKNGIPTDDDLLKILHRGIPGSSMPAFTELSDDEKQALIDHVRDLTRAGIYAHEQKLYPIDYFPDEAMQKAVTESKPGEVLPVPEEFVKATPESIQHGEAIFAKNCANCHGPKGLGNGPQVNDPKFINEDGTRASPRNLTSGVYKGGGSKAELYRRILLGIPGTPMPASKELTETEVQDLINFVQSLADDNTPAKPTKPMEITQTSN